MRKVVLFLGFLKEPYLIVDCEEQFGIALREYSEKIFGNKRDFKIFDMGAQSPLGGPQACSIRHFGVFVNKRSVSKSQ